MAFKFGPPSSTPAFSFPSFSTPTSQQQPSSFQLQQPQPQQQQAQQIQLVVASDKSPITYHTKWDDIHPDSQNLLIQIEEKILEYRNEGRLLDQCQRLHDTCALNESFELDAARISQELGGISTSLDREKASLKAMMKVAKDMMRDTEIAVRSFMILRPRFARATAPATNTLPATTTGASNLGTSVPNASPSPPIVDFYSGIAAKPSSFFNHTVLRFERQIQEYAQWIEEVERLLLSDTDKENGSDNSELSLLQSLPAVLTNIHEFFIYVAAQVESLHQQIASMRLAYLADQQWRGDFNNPFLEADRREVAKQEAAAKRVHPTLHHVSFHPQLTTQAAGILTSSATPSSAPQISSFGPGTSATNQALLSTPSSFSTPTPSLLSTTPSIFGASTQLSSTPSLFGPGTSSSVFGSSPAIGSSSSMFSSSTFTGGIGSSSTLNSSSSGLFGSSPSLSSGPFGAAQTSSNLFNTPTPSFGGGSLFGMGAVGQTSMAAKPKTTRTSKRK